MPLLPWSSDYEEEGDTTPSTSTNHSTDDELSNADTPWDEFYGPEQYYGDCTNEFAYYNSNGPSESVPGPSFDPQSECAQDEIDTEDIAFAQEIHSRTTIDSSIPFLPLERTDSNRSIQLELCWNISLLGSLLRSLLGERQPW
jgi:hypothetical protein